MAHVHYSLGLLIPFSHLQKISVKIQKISVKNISTVKIPCAWFLGAGLLL